MFYGTSSTLVLHCLLQPVQSGCQCKRALTPFLIHRTRHTPWTEVERTTSIATLGSIDDWGKCHVNNPQVGHIPLEPNNPGHLCLEPSSPRLKGPFWAATILTPVVLASQTFIGFGRGNPRRMIWLLHEIIKALSKLLFPIFLKLPEASKEKENFHSVRSDQASIKKYCHVTPRLPCIYAL